MTFRGKTPFHHKAWPELCSQNWCFDPYQPAAALLHSYLPHPGLSSTPPEPLLTSWERAPLIPLRFCLVYSFSRDMRSMGTSKIGYSTSLQPDWLFWIMQKQYLSKGNDSPQQLRVPHPPLVSLRHLTVLRGHEKVQGQGIPGAQHGHFSPRP